jgi:hypothetical protein
MRPAIRAKLDHLINTIGKMENAGRQSLSNRAPLRDLKHLKKIKGVIFGSKACSISDLLLAAPELFKGRSLLVSCLDSDDRVCSILRANHYNLSLQHQCFGLTALIENPESVLAFLGSDYISRFVELWVLEKDQKRRLDFLNTSSPPRFTSDHQDFSKDDPSKPFIKFFNELRPVFAVADGFDLNYAARDDTAAKQIDLLRFGDADL